MLDLTKDIQSLTTFRLEQQPIRCPLTRNKDKLRYLLYGRRTHVYPVIYRVIENQKQVEVLHIRHGARRKLKPSDLM